MRKCGEFEPEIHTYQEYKKSTSYVSYVTFKSTLGARNALKRKLCASVDEWLEPEFIGHHLHSKWPKIEPVREVDYISGLSDKCLIDVFSYLCMADLLNLSKVSQQFHRIVSNFMISKTDVELLVEKDLKNVNNFLKTFGRFVTKLKLYSNSELRCCREVCLLIPKYCLSENLKCLDLSDIHTNDWPIEAYRNSRIFSELRVLKILVSTNTILMEEIVKLCSSLKTLHVRSGGTDDEVSGRFLIHLPVDVERVTIKAFCEDKFFHRFIERSMRLKELCCHIRTSAIIAKIVECQPQLEKLEFKRLGYENNDFSIDKHALSIKNMKQLKSFKLKYPWYKEVEMINVVSEMDTVEHLIIHTEENGKDVFLPAIQRMKNLKNLRLNTYPSDIDMTNIWKHFFSTLANTNPNLENLDINSFIPFEYYLPVISCHPKLRNLVLYFEEEFTVPGLFDMDLFRTAVKCRAQGKQNFPIVLKVEVNTEVRHFSKITNKYDHLVRIVAK